MRDKTQSSGNLNMIIVFWRVNIALGRNVFNCNLTKSGARVEGWWRRCEQKKCWQMQFSAKRRAIPSEVKKLLRPSSLLCHNIQKREHRESLKFKRVHWIGLELNRVRKVSIEWQKRFFASPLSSSSTRSQFGSVSSFVIFGSERLEICCVGFLWLPRRAITFRRVSLAFASRVGISLIMSTCWLVEKLNWNSSPAGLTLLFPPLMCHKIQA